MHWYNNIFGKLILKTNCTNLPFLILIDIKLPLSFGKLILNLLLKYGKLVLIYLL